MYIVLMDSMKILINKLDFPSLKKTLCHFAQTSQSEKGTIIHLFNLFICGCFVPR